MDSGAKIANKRDKTSEDARKSVHDTRKRHFGTPIVVAVCIF
jgi:hypothetical protein